MPKPEASAAAPAAQSNEDEWVAAASLVADIWMGLPDGEEQIVAACAEAVRSDDENLIARWRRLIDMAEGVYDERLAARQKVGRGQRAAR